MGLSLPDGGARNKVKGVPAGASNRGPAFVNLFAYSLERQLVSLILAILLTIGIAILFPLRPHIDEWLEGRIRQLDEERSLKP